MLRFVHVFMVVSVLPLTLRGQGGSTELVSVNSAGQCGNNVVYYVDISGDGRLVVFDSEATNLVANDDNSGPDVFLHDRATGKTTCLSVDPTGKPGNHGSTGPAISADGRFVAFTSGAWNLGPKDDPLLMDVFLRDLVTNQTTLVSRSTLGVPGNGGSTCIPGGISADGRYIAFQSYASNFVNNDNNGTADIYVHDRVTQTTTRVSQALGGGDPNGRCSYAQISPDGGWIAYVSYASNLVANDTNGCLDVFLCDWVQGQTRRVSVSSQGVEGNYESWIGGVDLFGFVVAFASGASNLVPNDTNQTGDVFVHERLSGETRRVSLRSDGKELMGGPSGAMLNVAIAKGRVAFFSLATNTSDLYKDPRGLYVRDLWAQTTDRVSVTPWGQGVYIGGGYPRVSQDGRHIAYVGVGGMLPQGNCPSGGSQAYVRSFYPEISAIDPPLVGKPVRFALSDPRAAGRGYFALTALGYSPAIRIDHRWLYLSADPVLFLSATLPAVFRGYSGTLDARGQGQATLMVPNDPLLAGLPLWTAFLTLDPSASSGIAGVSNSTEIRLR